MTANCILLTRRSYGSHVNRKRKQAPSKLSERSHPTGLEKKVGLEVSLHAGQMNRPMTKTSQKIPTKGKIPVSRKPEAQKVRVKFLHCMGKSIRGISRDEKLNRQTVTKIIREPDVAAYVQGLREQWYTVGPACLKALRHALEVELDGNLAHKTLTAMGVVPKQPPKGINPIDIPALTEEEGQRRQAMMAGAALLEGNQQFGVDLPDDFAKKLIESAHTDVVEKKKP